MRLNTRQTILEIYINGLLVLSDNSSSLPTGLYKLDLDFNGGLYFYGNIKEVATFKIALTDSELEALTSWDSFSDMATGQEYSIR